MAPDGRMMTLLGVEGEYSIAYTKLPKGDRITLELSRETSYSAAGEPGSPELRLTLDATSAPAAVQKAAGSIRGTHVESLRLTPPSGDGGVGPEGAGVP